jgi:hypothetical protein
MTRSLTGRSLGPIDLAASWPQTGWQWVRLAGNIANLSTPLGALVAVAGHARLRRGPRGLVLAEGYRLPFPVAGAFTVGSVIITRETFAAKLARSPGLLRHEERHSWQYLYCLGLPFFAAYGGALVWSLLRTGDLAAANFFERQAGLADGGYRERPRRPVAVNLREVVAQLTSRSA